MSLCFNPSRDVICVDTCVDTYVLALPSRTSAELIAWLPLATRPFAFQLMFKLSGMLATRNACSRRRELPVLLLIGKILLDLVAGKLRSILPLLSHGAQKSEMCEWEATRPFIRRSRTWLVELAYLPFSTSVFARFSVPAIL
jgi:hypothetical protein